MPETSPYRAEPMPAQARTPPHMTRATRVWLQNHWQKLAALVFWLLFVGGYVWYTRQYDITLADTLKGLKAILHAPYGPLLYILLFTLRPVLLFSAALLTMIAGCIFGPVWGVIYTIAACNVSATATYLVGRSLAKSMPETGTARFSCYIEPLRRNSFDTVLLMNLLYLPFDLVNYLAGFLHINYRAFLLGAMLGSIPGIISCVLMGAALHIDFQDGSIVPSIEPGTLVLSLGMFAGSLLLSQCLKHWRCKLALEQRES